MKKRIRKWLIAATILLLLIIVLSVFEIHCFGCFPAFRMNRHAYFQGENLHVCVNNFPDRALRNLIREQFCTDGSKTLSREQISAIREIDCSGIGCRNLQGIDLLISLRKLDCSDNRIRHVPLEFMFRLTDLDCSGNQITKLNFANNAELKTLNCERNRITSLSFPSTNPAQVTWLDCSDNLLSGDYFFQSKSLKNTLTYLDCGNNRFQNLDLYELEHLTQAFLSPQYPSIRSNPTLNKTLLPYGSHNRILSHEASADTIYYTVQVVSKSAVAEMEVRAAWSCWHQYEFNGPLDAGTCVHCGEHRTWPELYQNLRWGYKILLWSLPLGCVLLLIAVVYLRRRKNKGKDWGEVTNVQIHDRDLQNPDRKR